MEQKWHPNGPKATKMEPKGCQKGAWGAKRAPKATKMESKGPKWNQKGVKREPKATKLEPKGPTWSQKGAKREPKGDQNASKNRYPKKVAKRRNHHWENDTFWDPNPSKMLSKIDAKIDAEKVSKNLEKSTKMELKSMPKSKTNRCDFGTCDFLIFAESPLRKSFFYMIRGTKNR